MSRSDNTIHRMVLKTELGTRIKNALSLKGKMQKDLAKELGVSANTISYFCSGSRSPNIEQLIKIATFLNITTDYLLGLTGDPNITSTATYDFGLSAECSLSTINRALGMIEGVSCGVNNPVADTLIDAVEMIDNAVKELTNGK